MAFTVGVSNFGDWAKTQRILHAKMTPVYRALGRAWRKEAGLLKRELVKGIESQAPGGQQFKPLKPMTLAVRRFLGFRGTKALIWHRNLLGAIKVRPTGIAGTSDYQVFVGIHKDARDSQGKSLYMIGVLQENGGKDTLIRITPKMRRFLGAVITAMNKSADSGVDKPWWLKKAKGNGVIMIRIPARPVFKPIWDKNAKRVAGRIITSVEADLKGTLAG